MKKKALKLILLILLIAIQAWFLYITFSYSNSGIKVRQNVNNDWIITSFEQGAIAQQSELKIGDIIVKVNDQYPEAFASIKKWRYLDQSEVILLSRNEKEIKVEFTGSKFTFRTDLLPLMITLICFSMAAFVYMKMKPSRSAIFLTYVFLIIGTTFVSLGASIRGDVLGKIFIGAGVMLTPFIILHFLIVLFNEKGGIQLRGQFIKYFYMLIIAFSLLRFFFFTDSSWVYPIYQFTSPVILLIFSLGLIVDFVFIAYTYMKYRKKNAYIPIVIKTVGLSLLISFSPFLFLFVIPEIFLGKGWVDTLLTSYFMLFFPISFTYLITTKQLYDFTAIMRRIKLTMLVSIVPGAAMAGAVLLLFPADNAVKPFIFLFIIFVVILSFLLYSVEHFKSRLEAIIFPRKHHLQLSINKIAKNLGSISSFRELKDIILVDIVLLLEVYGGAIVFQYHDRVETIKEGDIDSSQVERIAQSGVTTDPEYTCMRINHHEEYTSYLILTKKRSNTLLATEEKEWLNIIISYLAVSMENIYLIRKLTVKLQDLASHVSDGQTAQEMNWFRKITFSLQEKERMRIASDLHDTTIQDLYFLKKRLVPLFDKLKSENKHKADSIYDYIEIINSNLRQSCFELHPHLLQEIGLTETVKKMIERELISCPFDIKFEAEHPYVIEQYDLETQRHIFRIIQELINNAKKHSNAHKVHIRLSILRGLFHLNYKDDGVGFEGQSSVNKEIDSAGMGMEQLKSRVFYLGGHIEIHSVPDDGVKIHISIPLKEEFTA